MSRAASAPARAVPAASGVPASVRGAAGSSSKAVPVAQRAESATKASAATHVVSAATRAQPTATHVVVRALSAAKAPATQVTSAATTLQKTAGTTKPAIRAAPGSAGEANLIPGNISNVITAVRHPVSLGQAQTGSVLRATRLTVNPIVRAGSSLSNSAQGGWLPIAALGRGLPGSVLGGSLAVPGVGGLPIATLGTSLPILSLAASAPILSLGGSAPILSQGGFAPILSLAGSAPILNLGGSAPILSLGSSAPVLSLGSTLPVGGLPGGLPVADLGGTLPVATGGASLPAASGVGERPGVHLLSMTATLSSTSRLNAAQTRYSARPGGLVGQRATALTSRAHQALGRALILARAAVASKGTLGRAFPAVPRSGKPWPNLPQPYQQSADGTSSSGADGGPPTPSAADVLHGSGQPAAFGVMAVAASRSPAHSVADEPSFSPD